MSAAKAAVEAEAFHRRRRVAAFARGFGEPPTRSPVRLVAAGVAVGSLLLLGAAVLGAFGGR
ncbi:hypothetical protein [Nocardioides sp. YIM 152588]|uniref:hypothetical protein n=1 Tax=Nocardioides sp. YIM 152588 TaxID=3158259 RepID=UPI0032E4F5D4